jgi:mono/diheme cytochrome c family protein
VSALIGLGCSGESADHSQSVNAEADFSLREGRRLYSHYCSPCHGENGDGAGKYLGYEMETSPPDFSSPDFLRERDDELLVRAITAGSSGLDKSNLCPPWGKTIRAAEIEFLADYIKFINETADSVNEVN